MPEHVTWSPPAFSSARAPTAPERKSAAAALAINIPLVVLVMMLSSLLLVESLGAALDAAGRLALRERPAAARPRPGRTAEAVRAGGDGLVPQRTDVVQVPDGAGTSAHRELEHLIEVAIVEGPVPADAHQVAAHEPGHGGRVEVVHEESHVEIVLAGAQQLGSKTRDRHVAYGAQLMELDPEVPRQLRVVARFEVRLGAWE